MLLQLHEAHPGITKMKSLARLYVWWPGIDKEIEKSVKQCRKCQPTQVLPPSAPLHPWKWPSRPWTRLHIDYCVTYTVERYLWLSTRIRNGLSFPCVHCKFTEHNRRGTDYSAFNLERPFLCFVVNNSCFCHKKLNVIAIWLKFGLKVHTSLLDKFGKFKVFLFR